MNVINQQGWTCPKCSRVWAPHIAACGPCNQGIASFPSFGVPGTPLPPRFTCSATAKHDPHQISWNFTGDDLSYGHQDGDPA